MLPDPKGWSSLSLARWHLRSSKEDILGVAPAAVGDPAAMAVPAAVDIGASLNGKELTPRKLRNSRRRGQLSRRRSRRRRSSRLQRMIKLTLRHQMDQGGLGPKHVNQLPLTFSNWFISENLFTKSLHYGRVTSPLALLSRVNKPSGPGAHLGLLARVEPAPYRLLAAADQESGDDSDDEEESGDGERNERIATWSWRISSIDCFWFIKYYRSMMPRNTFSLFFLSFNILTRNIVREEFSSCDREWNAMKWRLRSRSGHCCHFNASIG